METILFLFVALPAFITAFWVGVKYIAGRQDPVRQSYPSVVNQKLQLDYDQIKSI